MGNAIIDFKKARKFVKTHGSPLLVLSLKQIKENYASLREAMPQAKICYAVKANPAKEILKKMKKLGSDFEIASWGELLKTRSVGYPASRLLNTNPVKTPEDIISCRKAGVNWFVYDNFEEIKKLARLAPNVNVLLRLSFPNRNCQVNLSSKFGALPRDALTLIEEGVKAGLKVRGLHFHVGSQMYSAKNLLKAIRTCRRIFDNAARKDIAYFDILDVGGGYPAPYLEPQKPIQKFCSPVKELLNRLFPSAEIWIEPGRFIPASAVTLITRVIGKSIRRSLRWYYLDDGVYNSFSGRIYDHCDYRYLTEKDGERRYPSVLAGPTCDSFDVVKSKILLPDLNVGDLVIIPTMGAYTSVSATHYNGFLPAKMLTID